MSHNFFIIHDAPPAAAVMILLAFIYLSFIICRFGEGLPPETASIARLTARCTKSRPGIVPGTG